MVEVGLREVGLRETSGVVAKREGVAANSAGVAGVRVARERTWVAERMTNGEEF